MEFLFQPGTLKKTFSEAHETIATAPILCKSENAAFSKSNIF